MPRSRGSAERRCARAGRRHSRLLAQKKTVSHIAAADLFAFSKRDDAIVLLAAAGAGKLKLIRQVIELRLCNALITDDATAKALL